jgi:hypothetical protein
MTTIYTLTAEWQKIGEGSSAIKMLEGLNAWIYAGDSEPSGNSEYSVLAFKFPQHRYQGNLSLYAKIADNSTEVRTRLSVTKEGNIDSVSLEDGEVVNLPNDTTGNGFAQLSDNEAWAQFSWNLEGTPVLMTNSANVSDSDEADKLCFFRNENNENRVTIKNRLGATKELTYQINYK